MNIAQLSEQLKDVPQNRLVDYAKNPNSVVPQFLALAEIQRRQHLQATPQPPAATVAEDVLAQAQPQMPQQMPPQMAPQPNPQEMAQQLPENQPGVAQLPSGMPQGMAAGGIVAFARGGEADGYDDEDDDDIQDQRQQSQMMSLIAGLRAKAQNAAAAIPRALESVRAAVPMSYDRVKSEVASRMPTAPDNGIEGFLSKIQHLESRGKDYDNKGRLLTSPKGAEGRMQVMPKTQKDPGYGVAPARDKSPEELARVGRDYGIAMLNEFKDPKLAAMAYNWGPANVKKWLASDKSLPIPKETQKYASHFAQGGLASFAGDDGSFVEEDEDYDNAYLNRSRGVVSGVRSLYDAFTTPKNYDLYDMYQRNIGEPFARGVSKFTNEPVEDQATRFRRASMNPTDEGPKVGYREPLGVNVEPPKVPSISETPRMTLDEANRLANISAANHAQKKEGLFKPVPTTAASAPTQYNFPPQGGIGPSDYEMGRFQEQAGPQEIDPYRAALLRADQERQDIKAQAETDKYLAMLQASLGMMAGTSPYAMANIGQGGMQGVAAYAAAKKQRAAELSDLNKYEARVMNAKESSEIKRAQLASLEEERQNRAMLNRDRLDLKASDSADISNRKRLELINRAQQDAASDPEYKAIVKIRDQLPEDDPKRKQYEDFLESIKRSYIATAETGKYVPPVRPVFTAPPKEPSLFDRIMGKGSNTPSNVPAPPPGFKVQ